MSDNIRQHLMFFTPYIIIIVLIAAGIFGYSKYNNTKNELAAAKSSQTTKQTIATVDAKTEAVVKKNDTIIPKIDANIAKINNSIQLLSNKVDNLQKNKPTKEESNAIFKNESSSEISRFFNSNGFYTVVKSCNSK